MRTLLLSLVVVASFFQAEAQTLVLADSSHAASQYLHTVPAGAELMPAYGDRVMAYLIQSTLNGKRSPNTYCLLNSDGKAVQAFSPEYMLSTGSRPRVYKSPGKALYFTPGTGLGIDSRESIVVERVDSLGNPGIGSFKVRGASKWASSYNTSSKYVAILQNGKILVSSGHDSLAGYPSPGFGRLNADGSFDTTFRNRFRLFNGEAPTGLRTGNLGEFANGNLFIEVSANSQCRYDNQIVTAPGGYNSTPVIFTRPDGSLIRFLHDTGRSLRQATIYTLSPAYGNHYYYQGYDSRNRTNFIRRSLSDGQVDTSFGSIMIAGAQVLSVNIIGFLPDSSFIVRCVNGRGVGFNLQFNGDIGYARILHSGQVDTSFRLPMYVSDITSIHQTGPNKVVASGSTIPAHGETPFSTSFFSLDGRLSFDYSNQNNLSSAFKAGRIIPTQNGGYYVVGGHLFQGRYRPFIQRFLSDGHLDTNFRFRAAIELQGIYTYATSLLIRSTGQLILGGNFRYQSNGRWVGGMVGLLPDGRLDPNFQPPNLQYFESFRYQNQNAFVYDIQEDSAHRLYAAGRFNSANGVPHFNVIRLLSDGTVDPSFAGPDTSTYNPVGGIYQAARGQVLTPIDGIQPGAVQRFLGKLDQAGMLDTTYRPWAPLSGFSMYPYRFLKAEDGGVYVVGRGSWSRYPSETIPLAKLKPDSYTLDTAWTSRHAHAMHMQAPLSRVGSTVINGVTRLSNGGFLLTGQFPYGSPYDQPQKTSPFMRIHADGTVDTSQIADTTFVKRGAATDAFERPNGSFLLSGEFYFRYRPQDYTAPDRTMMVYATDITYTHPSRARSGSTLFINPNPAHDVLFIKAVARSFTSTLQDLTGHTVRTGNSPTLNLQGLAPGLYVLKVDGYTPTRVVVE